MQTNEHVSDGPNALLWDAGNKVWATIHSRWAAASPNNIAAPLFGYASRLAWNLVGIRWLQIDHLMKCSYKIAYVLHMST